MKRRSKKSKATEKAAKVAENGTVSSSEEAAEPAEKRSRKSAVTPKKGTPKKGKSSPPAAVDSSEEEEEEEAEGRDHTQYEVEKVLDQKSINGVRHYLIRWKGYEPESDTWEPASTLNCPELIAEFNKKQKKIKSAEKPAKRKKLARKGASEAENNEEEWDENEDFEVDRILDVYFKKNGKREFLVSWKGYPASQNSWEPEENMDCKDLIVRYMDKVDRARKVDQRELRVARKPTDHFTLSAQSYQRRLSKRHVGRQRVHYHETD